MALTKKQREVFDRFARNILVTTLVAKLQEGGQELNDDIIEKINLVIDQADVTNLSTAAGEKVLELVDFATFVKVEKFLTTEPALQALNAAQQVGVAVQKEVYAILNELFGEATAE